MNTEESRTSIQRHYACQLVSFLTNPTIVVTNTSSAIGINAFAMDSYHSNSLKHNLETFPPLYTLVQFIFILLSRRGIPSVWITHMLHTTTCQVWALLFLLFVFLHMLHNMVALVILECKHLNFPWVYWALHLHSRDRASDSRWTEDSKSAVHKSRFEGIGRASS